jgi:hypothetical protein
VKSVGLRAVSENGIISISAQCDGFEIGPEDSGSLSPGNASTPMGLI